MKRLIFLLLLLVGASAFAAGPVLTYHGRILDASNNPVVDSAVQFKLQIKTPDSAACLLYEETQTVDMSASQGSFSLTLNGSSSTRTDSSGYSLSSIFSNLNAFTVSAATCASGGGTWTPSTTDDGRSFVVQFKTSAMATWEPLPAQSINFAPFAVEARQITGYPVTSLLRVANSGVPQTVSAFTSTQAAELASLASGSSTKYVQSSTNGAPLPSFATDPSSPTAGMVWYDSTNKLVKYYDGTSVQTVGSGGAVSGSSITSGTIGGSTSMNTSGTVTAASVSSTTDSTQNLQIWNTGNTHKATVTVPTGLAADYSLQLPGALPTASSQVLVSNTSGVTSWSPAITIDGSNNVGIGTTTPSSILSFGGAATRKIGMENNPTAASNGNSLTVQAGGSGSNADKNGGDLILSSGSATGNGYSAVVLNAVAASQGAGTTARTPTAFATFGGNTRSTAIGFNTTASGPFSIAMGDAAVSSGATSVAIGKSVTAAGDYSVALGQGAVVNGNNSFGISLDGSAMTVNQANSMVIGGGEVGIGTTAPFYPLTVAQTNGGTAPQVLGLVNNAAATTGTGAALEFGGLSNTHISKVSGAWSDGTGTNGYLSFSTLNSSAMTEAMRITAAGRVGIGTVTPGGNLDVDNAGHNATICLNGTCTTTLSGGGGGSQSSATNFVLNSNSDGSGTDGGFNFQSNGSNILQVSNTGAITTYGNITGNSALAVAAGGTNQNLALLSSGTGAVNVGTGNGTGFSVLDPGAASANYVTVKGAATGNAPVIGTAGSDTNINLVINPKGTGNIGIGTTAPTVLLDMSRTQNTVINSAITNPSNGNAAGASYVAANDTGRYLEMGVMGSNGVWGYQQPTESFLRSSDNMLFWVNNSVGDFRYVSTTGELMRLTNAGKLGIGTTTPSNSLSLGGGVARTIAMENNPTAANDGNDLTIQAGGGGSNADNDGGDLILNSGKGTGSGSSGVLINVTNDLQGTGTTVRTPNALIASFNGNGRNITMGEGAFSNTGRYSMLFSLDGSTSFSMTQSNSMAIMGGLVGIGTNAPITQLEVMSTTSPVRGISSTQISADNYGGIFNAAKARGTSASKAAVQSGDYIGGLVSAAHDGTTYVTSGFAGFAANGTIATGSVPVDFVVQTGSTVTPTERMRILSSGNVGIGTATPGGNLAVDNAGHNATICLNGTCTTTLSGGGGSQSSATNFVLNSNSDGSGTDGGFNFQSNGSNILQVSNTGAITTYGNITGNSALAVAAGGTNQNLALLSSGTGAVNVGTGNGTALSVLDLGAGAVNYVTVKGAATGNAPVIGTAGSDTDINLLLTPKGTGGVGIGSTAPVAKLDIFGTDTSNANTFRAGESIDYTVAPSANISGPREAIYSGITIPGSNTFNLGPVQAVNFYAQNSGTGTLQQLTGSNGFVYNATNTTIGNMWGSYVGIQSDAGTISGTMRGSESEAMIEGGTTPELTAIRANVHADAGTVTDVKGVSVASDSMGATATNLYGVQVNSTISGGSVSKRYGIYLAAPVGTATTEFGFYQAGTQNNYFGGQVGIGTLTPAGNLAVDNAGHNATICLNGVCSTTLGGGGGSQSTSAGFTFNSNSDGTGSDGGFDFQSNGSSVFKINNTGGITTYGNITGNSALAVAAGGTNQNLALLSSGTGSVNVGTGNGTALSVLDLGAGAVNYVTVKGAATGNAPAIGTGGSDTNINLALLPKGTGKVGIGTGSPATNLDVTKNAASTTAISVNNSSTTSGSEAQISMTAGTSSVQVGIEGPNSSYSVLGNGESYFTAGRAVFWANAATGYFRWVMNNDERMRIDSDGNVGIGTDAPGALLDVYGNAPGDVGAFYTNTNANGWANNLFRNDLSYRGWVGTGGSATNAALANRLFLDSETAQGISLLTDAGDLRVYTKTAPSYVEVMRITNDGAVGIGTTTPKSPLEVYSATTTLTTLNGGITNSSPANGGTLTVGSTTGYPAVGAIVVGSEVMTYSGLTGTTFTGIQRGAFGTTSPATTATGTTVNLYTGSIGAGSASAPALAVTTNSVGVGTGAPTQTLDVNGNVGAKQVVLVNGQATSGGACTNAGAIAIDASGDLYICK